jgi:hypothetical protein
LISLRTTVVALTLLGAVSLLASSGVAYAGSDTPTMDAEKRAARERATKKSAVVRAARSTTTQSLIQQRVLEAAKKAKAMDRKRAQEAAKQIDRMPANKEEAAKKVAEKNREQGVKEAADKARDRQRVIAAARRVASQQKKQVQETISVALTVIQASKDGTADPKLATLQNEISRSFKGYKGFTLIETHAFQIKHADSAVKRLKNGKAVVFSNMGKEGSKLRVRLDIDGANVMMNVREGELWFHARREKGAKALILAVRARSQAK